MRNLPIAPLVSFVLAAFVLACGGNGDGGAATSTETSATSTTSPSRPAATEAPTLEPGAVLTTVEIVRKLRPSVVQVLTEDAGRNIFGRVVPSQGIGTGVILDEAGHVLTNNHVIRAGGNPLGPISRTITVTLEDGTAVAATVVGSDPATDLAVLQIDADGLTPAELGDVASLAVGARVVAIGFALGLEGGPTVTQGVVSAKGRTIEEELTTIPNAIQTDAGINPGNSGGPLVDEFGRVVGINTAIIAAAENIGFSIPIDLARPIAEEIIRIGHVERGFLGVGLTDVTPSLARTLGLAIERGVNITNVVPGSPADEAGLRQNDIIVGLEDVDVANSGALLEALRVYKAGEAVSLQFVRDGDPETAVVVLGSQPE